MEFKRDNPDLNFEASFPSVKMLQTQVSKENIREWLSMVANRVDLEQCFADRDLYKALVKTWVFGYR
jgi:hypothetical protein